jgi:hypothetical protein
MARKGPLPPLLLINPASTVTVRRDGQWQTIGPLKALVADVGDLNIVHRTVFSRPKESVNAPQLSPCAHQTEGQTNPTVCDRRVLRGKKVLNVEWDANGDIQIISFRPGEWELMLAQM